MTECTCHTTNGDLGCPLHDGATIETLRAQVVALREAATQMLRLLREGVEAGQVGETLLVTNDVRIHTEWKAVLADPEWKAAAEAYDAAIRGAAVLPWQLAVHAEARDYHQDANLPSTVLPEQVKNAFEDARTDAHNAALEAAVAVVASVREPPDRVLSACQEKIRALSKEKK